MADTLDKKTFTPIMRLNDEYECITKEQYNKEIDEAIERVGKGQYTTCEDLEKEMLSW